MYGTQRAFTPLLPMTKKEAQDLLGVSERTLDGYVKKYNLTVQYIPGKTGRRADYDPDELAKLKEQLEAPQSTATGVSAPPVDGEPVGPQGGAIVPLRPSALLGNSAQLVVIAPEHFPALVQALAPQSEGVPLSERLTLDLDGAAAVSGLARGFIRDAIGKKELSAKKIGRGWKIERTKLDDWVKKVFGEGET